MPRYRRPIRRRALNMRAAAIQIAVLTLMLVALLSFRDVIGVGTTAFVESLTSEDVQVAAPATSPAGERSGAETPTVDTEKRPETDAEMGDTAAPDDAAGAPVRPEGT
ncbi:hypothetical protein FRC98_08485 [Lujinxingia vulgaris]|uniref:Uncharacterized protein n=1 Tax=Lujinxingia vulgaris TaxID=2600176 RepID=A0A5C6XEE6_9DELT|nr:hypothetical protein [Lujinxingia vulgaris]TXD37715.1 hypothetical protein FRC98_08485 [Lujinxingia vulgaris]